MPVLAVENRLAGRGVVDLLQEQDRLSGPEAEALGDRLVGEHRNHPAFGNGGSDPGGTQRFVE